MADNFKVVVENFVMPLRPGTDAQGNARTFVGKPGSEGKLVYHDFAAAARLAGKVLDRNPDVAAQVRPLREGTGCYAGSTLYAVSVARKAPVRQ